MSELTQRVMGILEKRRGEYVSGESIAASLCVTRAAVCKAVAALRRDGHQITAGTNRGYALLAESDRLTEPGIRENLRTAWHDIPIKICSVTGSTNTDAKLAALNGAPHGTAILAEEQTAGRGRRGRAFVSPAHTGLYMSLVLRPHLTRADAQKITLLAAVAVCRALHTTFHVDAEIKWVNDIFYRGRKVCGILSEAVGDLESGETECVIVGIGLNVTVRESDFPPELRSVAGAVCDRFLAPRVRLAAEIINEVLSLLDSGENIRTEYREKLLYLNREISFLQNGILRRAILRDVAEDGALLVENADGEREALYSAEISIKA